MKPPNGSSDADRLRRDIARLQAAKTAPRRPPNGLRSPDFESEIHATVIRAMEEGRLMVAPDGLIVPMHVETEVIGEPFDVGELETIGAKIAVYRAAGFEMGKVPQAVQWRARALASLLEVVAASDKAPLEFIQAATKAIEAWIDGSGQVAEPWMLVLVGIMKTTAPLENGKPMTSKNPSEAARAVLASLCSSAPGKLPQQFVRPDAKKLERAGRALLEMRVKRTGVPGGGTIGPWSAAQKFAAWLGVHMPKQSDVVRTRMSRTKQRRPGKRKTRT